MGVGGGVGAATGLGAGIVGGTVAGIAVAKVIKRRLITHSPHYQAWKASKAGQAIKQRFIKFIQNDPILGDVQRELCDPMSFKVFKHPMKAPDGKTYEFDGIIQYMDQLAAKRDIASPFNIEYLELPQELVLPEGEELFEQPNKEVTFSEENLRPDHRKRTQILARLCEILDEHRFAALSKNEPDTPAPDSDIPKGPEFIDDFSGDKKTLRNIANGLEALKNDLLMQNDQKEEEWSSAFYQLLKDREISRHRYDVLIDALQETFRLSYDDSRINKKSCGFLRF